MASNRKLAKNWILAYSEILQKISEAPIQYNIWAAISVISGVLKKNVYLNRGSFNLYPNQYIVLVGPPGVGKGTAIHPAYDFPKRLDLVNMLSDRITAPRIIEKLAQGFPKIPSLNGTGPVPNGTGPPAGIKLQTFTESACVLQSTELPTLLTSSDWMLQFLCDAWDRNEFSYDTKNKGTNEIKDMCVSLIGACVPEYIRKLNKDATAAINGGFTARTIFVYAEAKARDIVWPESLEDIQGGAQTKTDLEHDLQLISQLKGKISFTQGARDQFKKFYEGPIRRPGADDSDVVQHFKTRMHVHVFKVAMAFCAADRDDLIIQEADMLVAIGLLTQVLNNLDKAFRGVGASPLAEATAKIQSFIESKGVCTRKEILQHNHKHVTAEDLDRILTVLVQIEFIEGKRVGDRYLYTRIDNSQGSQTNSMNIMTGKP